MQFETDFLCSYKDLRKANWARFIAMLKSNWLISISVLVGIPVIVNGPGIIEGDRASLISGITGPFILVLVYFMVITIITKMQFEKNKTTGNLNIHFTFCEDEFQMETPLVKNAIRYDALHRIDENRDFFFLKLSPTKMIVVQKHNCPSELIAFLQDKAVTVNSMGMSKI